MTPAALESTVSSRKHGAGGVASSNLDNASDHWFVPQSVRAIPRVAWENPPGKPSAVLIFGPPESSLRIIRHIQPVRRDGLACCATIFMSSDEKTRLLVARRLMHQTIGCDFAGESLRLHEEANAATNGVVVLTAAWNERERVQALLLASLEQDQALQRMLLRSGMTDQRICLDRRRIKDFLSHGGGISRHFSGPRTLRFRFSDFRLDDQVNFGVGLHLKLAFDDPEILDFALDRFKEFLENFVRREEPCAWRLLMDRPKSLDGANTDVLWSDQTILLGAGLNRPMTRTQIAAYLEMVCGLDGIDVPLSESLLAEGDSTRGTSVPWV